MYKKKFEIRNVNLCFLLIFIIIILVYVRRLQTKFFSPIFHHIFTLFDTGQPNSIRLEKTVLDVFKCSRYLFNFILFFSIIKN